MHRRDLDGAARNVCGVVLLHACARMVPPRRRHRHRHGRLGRVRRRALIGARLRAAARGRDFASRLFAILSVMRDLQRCAAALARRLRGGLTRLRVIDPLPEAAPAPALAPVCAAAADDSS